MWLPPGNAALQFNGFSFHQADHMPRSTHVCSLIMTIEAAEMDDLYLVYNRDQNQDLGFHYGAVKIS
jgi:hypothetical protein